MDFCFFCCKNSENIELEMKLLSKSQIESNIIRLLESEGISKYVFTWHTCSLPCDIKYLENKIKEDIIKHAYTSVDITINHENIILQYDDNPFTFTQIHFNTLI